MGAYMSSDNLHNEDTMDTTMNTANARADITLELVNVDVKSMKKRACSVDPKLAANPRRVAPPIDPKTCREGSIAMGKNGEFYVIRSGKWNKVSKKLESKKRAMIKQRLTTPSRPARGAKTPKRSAAKTPKRSAAPKRKTGLKTVKKSAKTPMRPRRSKAAPKRK